jgi:hypothetical protein
METGERIRRAAGRLADLEGHLGRYDSPGPLLRHLEGGMHGWTVLPGEEDDLFALRGMHGAAHARDVGAARAELAAAEGAAALVG